jgi:hypothetical protein
MKPPPESAAEPGNAREEERPGLPWLRNWRGVYGFVLVAFVVYVVVLALFSRAFS